MINGFIKHERSDDRLAFISAKVKKQQQHNSGLSSFLVFRLKGPPFPKMALPCTVQSDVSVIYNKIITVFCKISDKKT